MTRINCVPPETISTKQLHGEYTELPHVFGHTSRMLAAGRTKPVTAVPKVFTMGTGHVAFFMDKLGYIHRRYHEVSQELIKRGYKLNPRNLKAEFAHIPPQYWDEWQPDDEAMLVNQARIDQRWQERMERKALGIPYGQDNRVFKR